MNISANYDRFLNFVNSQIKPANVRPLEQFETHFRTVTISREAGSGGNAIAGHLIKLLERADSNAPRPWTLFDKNLIERVLTDHQLPGQLAKFFPEDRLTELQDITDEVFGLRPGSWLVVQQTTETMLKLAALGNVVLVGRGGNIVTRKLSDVLHVRLIGSLDQRIRRLAEERGISLKSARELLNKEDTGRRRYVKKYFNADIADPLLYHVVINTDLVSVEEAAKNLSRIVVEGF